MNTPTGCPFCGKPSTRGCAHLALAADSPNFVRECVDRAQGQELWRRICEQMREAQRAEGWGVLPDFTWSETMFCDELLRRLSWFGRMTYEWRSLRPGGPTRFWVLLWSRDPRRLWWELHDALERRAAAVAA